MKERERKLAREQESKKVLEKKDSEGEEGMRKVMVKGGKVRVSD